MSDTKERIERLGWMLSRGLLWPYPECTEEPLKKAMLFFGELPEPLFEQRKASIERDDSFREWLLLTDEAVGSEWLEELRGEYGIDVVCVDDLEETRRALLQQYHARTAPLKGASAQ
jgi:hypothetical protein